MWLSAKCHFIFSLVAGVWYQDPNLYHFSMHHASHHSSPVPATPEEVRIHCIKLLRNSIKRVSWLVYNGVDLSYGKQLDCDLVICLASKSPLLTTLKCLMAQRPPACPRFYQAMVKQPYSKHSFRDLRILGEKPYPSRLIVKIVQTQIHGSIFSLHSISFP